MHGSIPSVLLPINRFPRGLLSSCKLYENIDKKTRENITINSKDPFFTKSDQCKGSKVVTEYIISTHPKYI